MDYQYLAGFFDGEGNINVLKQKGKYYFQLRFYNTEKEVLEKIIEFSGFGKIYSRNHNIERYNRIYELYIVKQEDIKKVLINLLPFVISKKNQAIFVLEKLKLKPLTEGNFSKAEFQSFVKRKKNIN